MLMNPLHWGVVQDLKSRREFHHFTPVPEHASVPGRLTINDLPDELVVSIIEHVALRLKVDVHYSIHEAFPFRPYDHRTLVNLALCSHRFHGLVEPILYKYFFRGRKSP